MSKSNSEGMSHQNDYTTIEYCGVTEELGSVNRREKPLKLEDYYSEKEKSLYPAVFVITGYLASAFQWSINTVTQRVVFVLHKRFPF